MTHNALLFSSSVSFRPHNSLHLSLQSLLTDHKCPVRSFAHSLYSVVFGRNDRAYASSTFSFFCLVWFGLHHRNHSVCLCVCFFGRPHFEMEFAEIEQVHSQCSNCRQKRKRMSFGVNPLLIQIKMDTRMK